MHADFSMPEGFEDLSTEETAPIALYYNDDYLGDFVASFDDDFISFVDAKAIVNELYFADKPAELLAELSKTLDPHISYVCHRRNPGQCKILQPEKIGVVLDRNNYRATIHINYKYLLPASKPQIKYLPNSNAPFGIANKTSIFLNTTSENNNTQTAITVNKLVTVSRKNFELSALPIFTGKYNKNFKAVQPAEINVASVKATYRKTDRLFSVGTVSTSGTFMIPAKEVLGIAYTHDDQLVKNPDIQYGTPILISVSEPSVVQVSRNEVIIYSIFYTPGNYYLDTSSFATGVYNVDIKITSNQTSTTSRKLFIKKTDFAPIGESEFDLLIGFAKDHENPGILPTFTDTVITKIGYNQRLNALHDLDITAMSDFNYGIVGVEVSRFGSNYQASIGGVIATDKGWGFSILANYQANKSLNFYGQYRQTFDNGQSSDNALDILRASETTASLSMNASLKGLNFSFNANCSKVAASITTDYTASVLVPIYNRGSVSSSLELTGVKNSDGYAGSINLSMQLVTRKTTHHLSVRGDRAESKSVTGQASYGFDHTFNDNLQAGLSFDVEHTKANALHGQLHYAPINLNLQGSRVSNPEATATYLFNGTINGNWGGVYSPGYGVAVTKDMDYNSGILVKVNSANKEDKFKLSVNEGDSIQLSANKSRFIPLAPLTKYHLLINSASDEKYFNFANVPNQILFYPCNIQPVNVLAREYFVFMSTLVDTKLQPILNATVRGDAKNLPVGSDEYGALQLEVSKNQQIIFETAEQACAIVVPDLPTEAGILFTDSVICQPMPKNAEIN